MPFIPDEMGRRVLGGRYATFFLSIWWVSSLFASLVSRFLVLLAPWFFSLLCFERYMEGDSR